MVEDDADNREVLTLMLLHAGATVTATSSAAEALELFKAAPSALIVTDIAMPHRDGIWLLQALRATARPSVPVVAVTAHAMPADRARIQEAGFQGYLVKPIEIEDLIAVIQAAMRT